MPGTLRHEDTAYNFQDAVADVQAGKTIDKAAAILLSVLTPAERLSMLDGDEPFYEGLRTMLFERYNIRPIVMGSVQRLAVPGIRFSDGPRGVCIGNSTAFPVSMARGATFDVELERRVGDAIGKEARAQGANLFAGICINLPRHPAWGRSQETYSEDPLLLGAFGSALTEGAKRHVMPCVKHFALNSMENARFRVDVQVDDAALHEIYLPHFKRVIDAGAVGVMSAYNAINGEWAGQSRLLLTDILRQQWQFRGFVMSDFVFGLRDSALSLRNGLDLEAPFKQQRNMHLSAAIEADKGLWCDVEQACQRLLRAQIQHQASTIAKQPGPAIVHCPEHQALAREVAARSVVLLQNADVGDRPVLPMQTHRIHSIAIIGRLANADNTGDLGSSRVVSPKTVTLAEGLRAALPRANILVDDSDDVDSARSIASGADLVICIVGCSAQDEGEYVIPSLQQDPALEGLLPEPQDAREKEVAQRLRGETTGTGNALAAGAGGDRKSLRLRHQDQAIVRAVVQANPRTIMSIVGASAVILDDLVEKVPAILFSWYAGCQGGDGLADVLLGRTDASGRLPFSIPTTEEHLPSFQIDARQVRYDRWHGQRLLDKLGVKAAFPFGFGLSYTTFAYGSLDVEHNPDPRSMHDALLVRATIKNTGSVAGRAVLQAYGLPHIEDFAARVLVGFAVADLTPGETKTISFQASVQPLCEWKNGSFVLPSGIVDFEIAAYAGDQDAVKTTLLF